MAALVDDHRENYNSSIPSRYSSGARVSLARNRAQLVELNFRGDEFNIPSVRREWPQIRKLHWRWDLTAVLELFKGEVGTLACFSRVTITPT